MVSAPRLQRYEIHPLTKDQALHLLHVARGHALEHILTLALATGMRLGELLALRWHDINMEGASLQVVRTVSHLSGYGYREREPKTSSGRRKIVLTHFALEALTRQRLQQRECRMQMGEAWHEQDLVFSNASGDFLSRTFLWKGFHALLKKADLPSMRFHDLRHSAATFLLGIGVHPKVVQEILGHSHISMTLDIYSHVIPSMHQDAMEKLDNLFEGIR